MIMIWLPLTILNLNSCWPNGLLLFKAFKPGYWWNDFFETKKCENWQLRFLVDHISSLFFLAIAILEPIACKKDATVKGWRIHLPRERPKYGYPNGNSENHRLKSTFYFGDIWYMLVSRRVVFVFTKKKHILEISWEIFPTCKGSGWSVLLLSLNDPYLTIRLHQGFPSPGSEWDSEVD